ncbi:UDP-glucose 4-epimerase GalE [Motilimonas sp. 1_MG-2023]|uniref:UDP-glucose 4-epimerase GalE n=1 Tax=unclassified Motilimonas TaxID=2643697 RepID=UPI001E36D4C4|nr:UDP-glucose 4-epimerase GalE [Motilimonas sp. 1_MG-2023]MCE0558306.1 UDP-glucose 4-epimerase GalE [Motilimonas sp. E26]MDO6524670.1 UDP-glucose 4-epimerase GalE [Motilimonas sp. 1_MG-2023]
MSILITGGAGYIGSHTLVELLAADYDVVVIDNLCNSNVESLARVETITGKKIPFFEMDIRDKGALDRLFSQHDFDSVIHFAGLKAVGESTQIPLTYYDNNISGTVTLCEVMAKHNVKNIVFSSSATVYGDPATVPITEDFPTSATNAYGRSKLFIEEILADLYRSDNSWNVINLRYFNPVGAHVSGTIGEDPNGIPNNLTPYISQVAVGKLKQVNVFGDDYDTPDGTGVRDYIHVVDLAKGHVKAVEKLAQNPGLATYNLGTGRGYSVLEMIEAFAAASDRTIPYQIAPRRPGDIAQCYADPAFAKQELNWQAEKTIEDMTADGWRWQSNNPQGYKEK